MKLASFKISVTDASTISKIVDRAEILAAKHRDGIDRMETSMDLTACHNEVGLDLERLLSFPDFDFSHDVFGIMRHINRTSGELEGFFIPRCTKRA
jgi:hypothetical protein